MSGFGEGGENTTAKEYQSDIQNSHLLYSQFEDVVDNGFLFS